MVSSAAALVIYFILTVQLCTGDVINQIGRLYIEDIGFPGAESIAIDTSNNHIFAADPSSIAVQILSYHLSSDLSSALISLETTIHFPTVFAELLPNTDITLSEVTSVAYSPTGYIVAAVIPEGHAIHPGWLAFIDLDTLSVFHLLEIDLCYLPDHISVTDDGKTLIVACEGEPDDNEAEFPTHNPPGIVAIVDVHDPNINEWTVHGVNFERFNGDEYQSLMDELYITHQYASFSINVEPEYSAISDDDRYAYISLQEQNAIAVLDINEEEIVDIYPLGTTDYSVYGLDASDRDGKINIVTYPNLYGYRAPDAIDYLFSDHNRHYLFTANEGDTKDFDEVRVKDVILSEVTFGEYDITRLQQDEHLGRLKVSNLYGKNDVGEYEALYAFNSRDFTIWEVIFEERKPSGMELIYSSNNLFELITAEKLGTDGFNSDYYSPSFDERSDAKGPEPESIVVGKCKNGRKYVFIGLERVGGIFVFDISYIDDGRVEYVEYFNSRDFTMSWEKKTRPPPNAGDVGPEQLRFIDEEVYGEPLLIVAYPESSSIAMYRIDCGERVKHHHHHHHHNDDEQ